MNYIIAMKVELEIRKKTLDSFREDALRVIASHASYLEPEQQSELENQIYDSAVVYAKKTGTSTANHSESFRRLYQSKLRHIIVNLDPNSYVKNTELKEKIQSHGLSMERVVKMNPREIKPSSWKDYEQKENAEISVITHGELVATTTLFTCAKCHNNKCNYTQLQTRSADEGVTNIITCTICGHGWKQYN